MKKLYIFLFLVALIASCQKETDEVIRLKDQQAFAPEIFMLQNLTEIGELPESTIPLLTFEKNILKNGVIDEPSLEPTEFNAFVLAGESVTETKSVHIPAAPPKADIMFAFDLTGSMGGVINTAKANSVNIMGAIDAQIDDVQFGVASHMDYNGFFSGCGYSATYGEGPDYPYSLDQALTSTTTDVSTAITGLTLGIGYDGPENYTRVLYEMVADEGIGWREGAKKIVVFFLDAMPHGCDVTDAPYMSLTGPDPGRDNTVGTDDDLLFNDVINDLAAQNITLIVVSSPDLLIKEWWNTKAGVTGGIAEVLGTDITESVTNLIRSEVSYVDNLTLKACDPQYEDWVTADDYTGDIPEDGYNGELDVTFTVPEGTPPGEYCFDVCLVSDGVDYETSQHVCIITGLPVPFDMYPATCPNELNREAKGFTPVAILGTTDFDVTQIDPASITVEGVVPVRWDLSDVGTPHEPFVEKTLDALECSTLEGDGIMDLTLKLKSSELNGTAFSSAEVGDVVVVTMSGELLDGKPIIGEDVILIIK